MGQKGILLSLQGETSFPGAPSRLSEHSQRKREAIGTVDLSHHNSYSKGWAHGGSEQNY